MTGLFKYIKERVFIIAEIGCNFEGDLIRAKEMIHAAAEAGSDAVKFQTFIPERLASKHAKKFWDIEGCPGETQLEEYIQMPRLSFDEYRELKQESKRLNIIFFSTPSDEDSSDLLERLNIPLYKISSMDITHIPLLKHVAKKRKPMILSTGASTIDEIQEAVSVIKAEGNEDIALLHCITNYPTKDTNVNLRMITDLIKNFPDIPVGYSDHTYPENGEGIVTAAVALGARIIEKHFTFDNKRLGYDHAISVDYRGLKRLVIQVRRVDKALGEGHKAPIASENRARRHARRSIVASRDIPKGIIISQDMLDIKRPGTGIEPRHIDTVIGRRTKVNIPADTILDWDMI